MDLSNGYQENAFEFIRLRSANINVPQVRQWLQAFPAGSALLDIGCGNGFPITHELLKADHNVSAIDASATMVERLSKSYPSVAIKHEAIETSGLFGRRFDGVVAIGLVFLLSETKQTALLKKVAGALHPRGRFLFTAPQEKGRWTDVITNADSVSLGIAEYEKQISSAGMDLLDTLMDEQGNNHYSCQKR